MSEFAEGYAVGQGNNNYSNGFGFGGDWAWIIIFALIFGWGGNGAWGNNGGNGQMMYDLGKVATTNDVASGFSTSSIMNNLNDIKLGQMSLQQSIMQGNNNIERQLADCCCQTQRAIDGVNYNMAQNTCDIKQAINNSTQRMLDYWCQRDMQQLRDERDGYRQQLQINNQTANITGAIIERLDPTPKPSYAVPNPYTGYYGGYNRSCFSNCGSGCCNG